MHDAFSPLTNILRPHQEEAVRDVLRALERHARTQVLMACGTGKTRVGVGLFLARSAQRTVVFLPSLSLMSQTLRDWVPLVPGLRYLCVCSDPSVEDEVRDGLERGVTARPEDVVAFLEQPGVVFCTYQSVEVLEAAKASFDFGLFDEAHKTAGDPDKLFARALRDECVPIKTRVFMTATPRNMRAGVSMDDASIYGPVAHRLPFSQAVADGLICPYKVMLVGVRGSDLQGEPANPVSIGRVALRKAVKELDVKKVITFHANCAEANRFSKSAPIPGACAEHFYFDGMQSAGERERLKERFKQAALGVASNARCLTEGVDVPAVDMVAFFVAKQSMVDIVQAVGRAMRKAPGKEVGFVLVPVFVPTESRESDEEILRGTRYKMTWTILQALQTLDDALDNRARHLNRGGDPKAPGERLTDKIGFIDLDLGGDLTEERLELILAAQLDRPLSVDEGVEESKIFRLRWGRAPKQHATDARERSLAKRESRWRTAKRSGRLTPEEIALIETIPGWEWEPRGSLDDDVEESKIFRCERGRAPKNTAKDEHEQSLANRESRWRTAKRDGKLTPEEVALIETIPGWTWGASQKLRRIGGLDEGVEESKIFRLRWGRAPKRLAKDPHERGLADREKEWRVLKRKVKLTPEEIALVETIPGWTWEPWGSLDEDVEESKIFREKTGRAPKMHAKDPHERSLAQRETKWRTAKRRGELAPEEIALIGTIPGLEWEPRRASRKDAPDQG